MTPIVANLSVPVRQVINLMASREITLMAGGISAHSLIGQAEGGVSLEFNEDYARTEAAKGHYAEAI